MKLSQFLPTSLPRSIRLMTALLATALTCQSASETRRPSRPHAHRLSPAIRTVSPSAIPAESDVVMVGDIVVTPNPVLAGQEIVVRYQIKNQGTLGTSIGFTSRLVLKNQNEFTFSTTDHPVPALAAGEISTQEHHLVLPNTLFSGIYSARLRLDPFLELVNEANNGNDATDPFPFEVIAVLPDLKVTFAELCPPVVHPGDTVQLRFRVLNQSSSAAPAARSRIELASPRFNQKVFSTYLTNGVIAPHAVADYVFPFVVPTNGPVGKWNVSLFLNDYLDFAEADTFNNVTDPLVKLEVVAAGAATKPCDEPIRLSHPRLTGGRFTLDVTGSGNATQTVQVSTDLKTWTTAGPVTLTNGAAIWTAPPGITGFFRLVR